MLLSLKAARLVVYLGLGRLRCLRDGFQVIIYLSKCCGNSKLNE